MNELSTELANVHTIVLEQTATGSWRLRLVMQPGGTTSDDQPLAAMPLNTRNVIARHLKSDPASRTEDIATVFLEHGWTPSTPGDGTKGATYVRWLRNGHTHSAQLYQNRESLLAKSQEMRPLLCQVGGTMRQSDAMLSYRKSYDQAVEAIAAVTAWSDDAVG